MIASSFRHFLGRGLLALLLMIPAGAGAIPQTLSYQGYLTDAAGAPLNGPQSLVFSLYNVSSGGTALWSEGQAAVTVTNGLFSVKLGNGTLFPLDLFATPVWLGVSVNGDPEMSPRAPLSSGGYAFKAEDADRLEGMSAASLDQSAHVMDYSNPHLVTAAQVGAADAATLGTHIADTSNPHNVTTGQIGAVDDVVFSNHVGDSAAHHAKTTIFPELAGQIDDTQIPGSITRDVELAALQATVSAQAGQINTLQAQMVALQSLLQHFSRVNNEVYITGANLHIVDGTGNTGGTVNGLGNLVVGYNELRSAGNNRSGSHNLVVGEQQNYSSYGSFIAGYDNTVSGPYASVSGGLNNTASGEWASVSGGDHNTASFQATLVSGGWSNTANGYAAVVSGGNNNTASGPQAAVSGGSNNTASGDTASVSGGAFNTAFAHGSAILGGLYNLAGDGSCAFNSPTSQYECTPGTDPSIGTYSAIAGGNANRTAEQYASVGGGRANTASGSYASISGGELNTASGSYASVSGGDNNTAGATWSSVSGGYSNTASAYDASVNGGNGNTADGPYATVSGGNSRSATGVDDWVAGTLLEDF